MTFRPTPAASQPPLASATPGRDLETVAAEERAAIALLTGERAGDLLTAALAKDGADLVSWQVHEVHHRPGAGVTVGYTVTHARDSAPTSDYLLLSTAQLSAAGIERGGAVTLTDGTSTVHAWRHPNDPELPALAVACEATRVAAMLAGAGLPVGPEGVSLELLAYRPTRRAVLRARSGEHVWYIKVLRPGTVDRIRTRHGRLAAAGVPVPRVLYSHGSGLLVLSELTGTPLAASLADDGAAQLDPRRLLALLDTLPDSLMELERRPAWSDRVRHHGHAAQAALPGHEERIASVVARVELGSAAGDLGPLTATHGDFYEAQLFEHEGRVVGVLDVDTAGPGHRVDDLACLLGHLDVLPDLAPEVYEHVPTTTTRWLDVFDLVSDPVTLRVRTAGVVLSLVAGAQTRDEALARLGRAEAWLDDAAMVGLRAILGAPRQSERTLIDLSLASHAQPMD